MDEFTATYSTLLKSELLGVDAVVSDGRLVHTRTYTCARAVTYSRALTRSRALGRLGEEKTAVWSPQRNLFRYQARPAATYSPAWVWLGSLDGLRSAPLACASTCHSCGVVRPCAPSCGRTHALRAGLIGCLFVCALARSRLQPCAPL